MTSATQVAAALLELESEALVKLNNLRECMYKFNSEYEDARLKMAREHAEKNPPLENGALYSSFSEIEQEKSGLRHVAYEVPNALEVLDKVFIDLQFDKKLSPLDKNAILTKLSTTRL